jgi:dihydrofolate reductase
VRSYEEDEHEQKGRTHETDNHNERKDKPMKLTTNTQISVDGVVQANGGPDENGKHVLDRGGWARPLFDDEAMKFVDQFYQRADAFLFGQKTYELFAGYWGVRDDLDSPIVRALNTKPKYVASNTPTDPKWANTTVLSGDLAAAIGELKAKPGGELQVHGSGTLIRWLLANDLVDEINLLICPVVVGQGTRLFPDDGPDMALELVDSQAFPRGITLQVYRPNGRPEYAT